MYFQIICRYLEKAEVLLDYACICVADTEYPQNIMGYSVANICGILLIT